MRKDKPYVVEFDTQKDRRYITWNVVVMTTSQSKAKDIAAGLWFSKDNPHQITRKRDRYLGLEWTDHPHMFHVTAKAIEHAEPEEMNEFRVIKNQYVTWGYKGNRW